jgi:hypothetical protein
MEVGLTGGKIEERLPAYEKTVHSIGHNRRKHGVKQCSGFEFHAPVEHLDRKERRPDRRAKNGG